MTTKPSKAGAREALGDAFASALLASWRANGKQALEAMRVNKPDLYVKLITAMLPRATELKTAEPDDLDDAALDRRIATLAAALGLALGSRQGAGGEDTAAGAKPAGEL